MMEERRYTAWIEDGCPGCSENSIEFDDLRQEELLFLIKLATDQGHFVIIA